VDLKFFIPTTGLTIALLLLGGCATASAPAPEGNPASNPASAPDSTASALPQPTAVTLSAEQVKTFHDYLSHAREEGGLPGIAVVLAQPGRTLIVEGFGLRSTAEDAPVTPDTRFALGPATQAVNSLLLARLAAQHLLDLDAPARRCWDDFKLNDPLATRSVTLGQLLTMTGGVSDTIDHVLQPERSTPANLFTVLAQLPVLAQPGDTFSYSETSPAAAGYLAVYAVNHKHTPDTGLPTAYAALAKAQLFDPVGMKRATFAASDATANDNDAVGHARAIGGNWHPDFIATTSSALLPAHGLRVSAHDVAAWLQIELNGGLAPDGTRLLAEEDVQQRWHPPTVRNSQQFGMGWAQQFYRGVEIVSRLDAGEDQAVLVAIFPQHRTAFAILSNAGGREASVFLQDALLNLADLLRESSLEK